MLLIKFWLNTGSNRIYVETEVEDYNYKDNKNIYLRNGNEITEIPRRFIEGPIEEIWLDSEEENGEQLDFLQ